MEYSYSHYADQLGMEINMKKIIFTLFTFVCAGLLSISVPARADSVTDSIQGALEASNEAISGAVAGKYDAIPDGCYIIENSASGLALDVYGGNNTKYKNNVQVYTSKQSDNQKFNIMLCSDGWYTIYPESDRSKALNPYSDKPKNGTNINIYKRNTKDKTQCWYLESLGSSKYIIRNAYNTKLVLASTGSSNGSNVQLAAYVAGNTSQIWVIRSANSTNQTGDTDALAGQVTDMADIATDISEDNGSGSNSISDKITGVVNEAVDNMDTNEVTEITNGWVYIVNKASKRALNLNRKGNAIVYDKGDEWKPNQTFYLQLTKKGWYAVSPCSETLSALNAYANKPKNGTKVNIYKKNTSDSTQGWYFEHVEGGWIIRNASNRSLVLAAKGTDNNAAVRIETYIEGNERQIWKIYTPKSDMPLATYKELPITAYNQGYRKWAGEIMGTDPNANIGGWGCTTSCMASLESIYQNKTYTPATVRKILSYDNAGNIQGDVFASYKDTYRELRNYYDQINAGSYVLIGMEKGESSHWVVIYGYKNVKYDSNNNPILKYSNFMIADSSGAGIKSIDDNDPNGLKSYTLSLYTDRKWSVVVARVKR